MSRRPCERGAGVADGIAPQARRNPVQKDCWIGGIAFKSILAMLALLGIFGALAVCNTVDGVGKELRAAGAATSDTARDVGRKM